MSEQTTTVTPATPAATTPASINDVDIAVLRAAMNGEPTPAPTQPAPTSTITDGTPAGGDGSGGENTDPADPDNPDPDATAANPENPEGTDTDLEELQLDEEETGSLLSDITGGEIGSVSDLLRIIEENKTLKKVADAAPSFVSPLAKQINDLVAANQDPNNFIAMLATNYDTMPDKEVLRRAFIRDNSDLSEEKASKLFEKDFQRRYDLENLDEDEAETAQILLERDANKERKYFNSEKEKFLQKPTVEDAPQISKEQEKEIEEFLHYTPVVLENFGGLTFEFEGQEFHHTAENIEALEEYMLYPRKLYQEQREAAGDNPQAFFEWLRNFTYMAKYQDQILSTIWQQGKNYGAEQILKQKKNPAPLARPAGSQQAADHRTPVEQAADALKAHFASRM